eukprot:m.51227 g.51227  ORF g.51227 m.51227 type:complete len:541 (+) comp6291_c0_seq1:1199-2821(+)
MEKRFLQFDSDDEFPLSQTDNVRPRSSSADLFKVEQPPRKMACKRSIQDRIHGHIELEPVLVAVIDTPHFQRLRSLKQLGAGDYVFPGACHTRFEHCLGVSHLAGELVRHLMQTQPELEISERDRLCIKLAALCHDIGHGPFSHMFELFVNRKRATQGLPPWSHESASTGLFRLLLTDNDLRVEDYGLEACDIEFIVNLIEGLRPREAWPFATGRGPEKRFLFDIVANKRNGIDVDKLDYFMRDSTAALGRPPIGCDTGRLIKCSRVCEVDGQTQICFEEKMALGILDIFKLRAWLHKYVYQHHTVKVIDDMLCDVLAASDPFVRVPGADGAMRCMSEAVDDMEAFKHLGDWVLWNIEASIDPALAPARAILKRLRTRDLYQVVHIPTHLPAEIKTEEQAKLAILECADSMEEIQDDLVVHFISIDYGSRDEFGNADNPLSHVRFFNPKSDDRTVAFAVNDRKMSDLFAPRAYSERLLYVYTRNDAMHGAIETAYRRWRAMIAREKPSVDLTPMPMANVPSPRKRARINPAELKGFSSEF